jgi:hypothetical protein
MDTDQIGIGLVMKKREAPRKPTCIMELAHSGDQKFAAPR